MTWDVQHPSTGNWGLVISTSHSLLLESFSLGLEFLPEFEATTFQVLLVLSNEAHLDIMVDFLNSLRLLTCRESKITH